MNNVFLIFLFQSCPNIAKAFHAAMCPFDSQATGFEFIAAQVSDSTLHDLICNS